MSYKSSIYRSEERSFQNIAESVEPSQDSGGVKVSRVVQDLGVIQDPRGVNNGWRLLEDYTSETSRRQHSGRDNYFGDLLTPDLTPDTSRRQYSRRDNNSGLPWD